MKILKSILLGALIIVSINTEAQIELLSPNNKIKVAIDVNESTEYSVRYDGNLIIDPSAFGLIFAEAPPLGGGMKIISSETRTVDESWKPVLKRKSVVRNYFNELVLSLQEVKFPKRKLILTFRAFNDGIAFRYTMPDQFEQREYVLMEEQTLFHFHDDYTSWAADHTSFTSSQEHEYFKRPLSGISPEMVLGLPVTIKTPNCYVAITESNLRDWAGLYLKAATNSDGKTLKSQLSPLPGESEKGKKVIFNAPHNSPWRVVIMADTPGELIESEIVSNLADPCELEDVSWIKPGISAWDHWWSGEVQMDNKTNYQYIDLASEMGWPYQIIDWQWYGPFNEPNADITTPAVQLDLPAIFSYAKSKNVRCILWIHSNDIQLDKLADAFQLYEQWGAAGVKIDFMDREDQQMVNWYRQVVETAAKYHLTVDFHGAYKPTGLRRTLPNLLTREGVLGNEYNKWSLRITPEHNVTLPFTRMLAGPMDFTPGGFLNRTPEKFRNGSPAHVLGTRCHQLAQFVIYDSPLTVACDHPDNYKGQVGVDFLKEVYTIWDDTRVLNGEIGEFITMARRNGEEWFLGSMTNSESRNLEITLDFLEEGRSYSMISFEDTKYSAVDAGKAVQKTKTVKKGDIVNINMAPGGGFAAFIK